MIDIMFVSFTASVFIILAARYLSIEAQTITNVEFESALENPVVQSKLRSLRQCLISKNADLSRERREVGTAINDENASDRNLHFLKHVLSKYLKDSKDLSRRDVSKKRDKIKRADTSKKSGNKKTKDSTEPKFDDWTSWSSCSVTCGKGRHIRWRHCRENCDGVETEMEEKECQLPACPNKLFGLIKL